MQLQKSEFSGDRGRADRLQPGNVCPSDGAAQMVPPCEFCSVPWDVSWAPVHFDRRDIQSSPNKLAPHSFLRSLPDARLFQFMYFLLQWLVQITCGGDACTMIMNVFGYTAMGQVSSSSPMRRRVFVEGIWP